MECEKLKTFLNLQNLRTAQASVLAVDFQKALDSLNYSFLLKVLEKFNFGP